MFRALLVTLSSAFFLAACGSSSSGSSSPPVSPPPPPGGMTGLVITAANAKPAARVAYGSTTQSMETGDLVGDSGIAGTPNGGFQKPGAQGASPGALSSILQKIPLGPDTYDCGVGGTQTISGDLASLFTLTTGDQINVDAVDCDDGLGEVINGRMEMTVSTFSGDLVLGLYMLEMNVVLIDFEVATATDTILSNGDSLVSMDTTGNPLLAIGISGNSMTVATNAGTDTMTSFSTAQTVDASVMPEPYTLSSFGTVDSSQLSGVISFTTPVTFQGAGAAYPFAGELLITGADNSTIRLIALDATNVRIETDTNGDGTVDNTEDTTWDDITL
jgi:hypothetical protein